MSALFRNCSKLKSRLKSCKTFGEGSGIESTSGSGIICGGDGGEIGAGGAIGVEIGAGGIKPRQIGAGGGIDWGICVAGGIVDGEIAVGGAID